MFLQWERFGRVLQHLDVEFLAHLANYSRSQFRFFKTSIFTFTFIVKSTDRQTGKMKSGTLIPSQWHKHATLLKIPPPPPQPPEWAPNPFWQHTLNLSLTSVIVRLPWNSCKLLKLRDTNEIIIMINWQLNLLLSAVYCGLFSFRAFSTECSGYTNINKMMVCV